MENEIKGRGMEVSSEVLDIQRAKRASEIASEVSTFISQLTCTHFPLIFLPKNILQFINIPQLVGVDDSNQLYSYVLVLNSLLLH